MPGGFISGHGIVPRSFISLLYCRSESSGINSGGSRSPATTNRRYSFFQMFSTAQGNPVYSRSDVGNGSSDIIEPLVLREAWIQPAGAAYGGQKGKSGGRTHGAVDLVGRGSEITPGKSSV